MVRPLQHVLDGFPPTDAQDRYVFMGLHVPSLPDRQ